MGINFERLKDAYAVIDGIPESAFDLDEVIKESNGDLACGTIACAAGWLMIYPPYAQILNTRLHVVEKDPKSSWIPGCIWFEDAMVALFSLDSHQDAADLFTKRHYSRWDEEILREAGQGISDKELWKARVRKFLAQHGQLSTTSKEAA